MSYDTLREKYKEFINFEEKNNKGVSQINITAFNVSKYKKYHVEFVQYVFYIYLRIKECNKRNNCYSELHIFLKGVNTSHFSPSFMKKIMKPFNELVKDDEDEILDKIYIYDVNKYIKYIWGITKHFYDPITIKKFTIVKNS